MEIRISLLFEFLTCVGPTTYIIKSIKDLRSIVIITLFGIFLVYSIIMIACGEYVPKLEYLVYFLLWACASIITGVIAGDHRFSGIDTSTEDFYIGMYGLGTNLLGYLFQTYLYCSTRKRGFDEEIAMESGLETQTSTSVDVDNGAAATTLPTSEDQEISVTDISVSESSISVPMENIDPPVEVAS